MQQSMQRTGSIRRREERVPLEARVELRTEDGSEPRKADGLNVSIGGLALRAASIPPVGATVTCRFACPSGDEPITARGEVVWARLEGGASGRFGLRFVELDTKSATSLRRFVGPDAGLAEAQDRLRSATIRIDGLGTSVEAELKLADETRVVLEQELSFLQLGRAVEVSVEGKGPERGRIASVELRQSALGGPTIVYGVLLDGSAGSEPKTAEAAPSGAPLFAAPPAPAPGPARAPALTESVEQPITTRMSMPPSGMQPVTARVAVPPRARRVSEPPAHRASEPPPAESPVRRASELPPEPYTQPEAAAARVAFEPPPPRARPAWTGRARDTLPAAPAPPPAPVPSEPAAPPPSHRAVGDDDDEPTRVHAGAPAEPPEGAWHDVARPLEGDEGDENDDDGAAPARTGTAAALRGLPLKVGLMTRALVERARQLGQRREPAELDDDEAPDLRTRLLLQVARVRVLLLAAWAWVRGALGGDGEDGRRPLRVQRATLPGGVPAEPRYDAPRRAHLVAAVLVLLGIALGVYALTPVLADRNGDAELAEAPAAATPAPASSASDSEPEPELDLQLEEPPRAPSPPPAKRRATGKPAKTEPAAEVAPVRGPIGDPESTPIDDDEPEPATAALPLPAGGAVFGDAEVPNGRTFTLRMNGPVKLVQGDAREHGFTVRIPGRVAIDRASPIATAHNSVARAMILNRAGHAELTIEFRPGVIPRYQVRGKDNTLEVTLERL